MLARLLVVLAAGFSFCTAQLGTPTENTPSKPASQCLLASTAPAGCAMRNHGHLKHQSIYRLIHDVSSQDCLNIVGDHPKAKSFSWDARTGTCKLFRKSLARQRYVPPPPAYNLTELGAEMDVAYFAHYFAPTNAPFFSQRECVECFSCGDTVRNGDFETGNLMRWFATYIPLSAESGAEVVRAGSANSTYAIHFKVPEITKNLPADAVKWAPVLGVKSLTLRSDVFPICRNLRYTLSFDITTNGLGKPSIVVFAGTTQVLDFEDFTPGVWQHQSVDFSPAGPRSRLRFNVYNHGYDNSTTVYLDQITLVPASNQSPE